MKRIKFVCPKCTSTVLDEQAEEVVITSHVEYLSSEGDIEYGEDIDTSYGEIFVFKCGECDYVLKDGNNNDVIPQGLYKWLEQRGMI
jgi:ribosomal protein S27AE